MMIDIDFFKRFNDTYGHSAGDVCLKSIGKALESSLNRSDDFVVRYGGEEFAVILPNTDEEGACFMAENLLKNVRNCNIPHEKNDVAKCVTISIGVTTAKVSFRQKAEDYIKRADDMLYTSKHNGRNLYSYAPLEDN
jgi:diguanylate cyclase (GGDEF)-like protein